MNGPTRFPSPAPQAPAGAVVGQQTKIDLNEELRTAFTLAGKLVSEMVTAEELPQQLSIEAFRAALDLYLTRIRSALIADVQISASRAAAGMVNR